MKIKSRMIGRKGTRVRRDEMEMEPKDNGFVRRTFKNPGQERKPPQQGFHNGHARQFMGKVE